MRYNIISTGSKGNAVVINGKIMVDCGVSFKKLHSIYRDLSLVLLTHEHSDHINKITIKKLANERPTLRFACCEWLVDVLKECEVENIDILEIGKIYNYGDFKVSPVKLYHNVPNCGYRLIFDNEKVFYATDTYTLEGIIAKNYDLYMVECNYEDEEISRRIAEKEEKGEFAYEYRAKYNHLSKAKCDDFICANAGINSKFVYLHQHEERTAKGNE